MTDDLTQHWRRSFENKYLGAWDLWDASKSTYREVQATIARVTREEVIGDKGRRSICTMLHLRGSKGPIATPMIVSKTSGTTLERMFGPIPKGWEGKSIRLYVRTNQNVQRGTGSVLTIRSTRGNDSLREAMQAPAGPAIAEEEFQDGSDDPDKGP
jgi:uncharacterized protein YukE